MSRLKQAGIKRQSFFHPGTTDNPQRTLSVLPLCRFLTVKSSEVSARVVGFGTDDSSKKFDKPTAELNN
jgi:hypothetical protein